MNPRVNVTKNLISSLVMTGTLILPLFYIPVGVIGFADDATAKGGLDALYSLHTDLL